MSIGKEELQAVTRVINSGVLSGYMGNYSDAFYGGEEVKSLEHEWQEYFGVKHAIFCNSATSGLWAALNAIGTTHDDEILVVPYSMTCSASIPLHFGAKPVFVDIEPKYFCMDPDDIERKITHNTKAIIPVSLFGQPCDMDSINEIAEEHGIYVIEDAAQSIGAKYHGKYTGTLSDIGVFSLNVHKHIQCGEGGMICTNDDVLAFNLRLSINHAEAVVNDIERQGYALLNNHAHTLAGLNLRGTELNAAVAREQLKKLSSILEPIQKMAECFDVKVRPNCEHAYYRYAMLKEPEIYGNLVQTKHHYIKPIYKMPLFRHLGYGDNLCPVCEEVEEKIWLSWMV